MNPRTPLFLILCTLWLATEAAVSRAEEAPEPGRIATAGRAAEKRLEAGAASWRAVHDLGNGVKLHVKVLQAGDRRKTSVTAFAGERLDKLLTLIEKDGLWYLHEGGKRGIYRPFEAPVGLPGAYLYLLRSQVRFITSTATLKPWIHDATDGNHSVWRAPVPDNLRHRLMGMVRDLDMRKRMNPAFKLPPQGVTMFERGKDILARGLPMHLDLANGMVNDFGSPYRHTRIDQFRWLDEVTDGSFATSSKGWADNSYDPTETETGSLVMMAHCAYWTSGMNSFDLDSRLLDVHTGWFRRIPYRGSVSLPGCFSADRKKVFVSGMTADDGAGLFEVDLSTGENRRLGGDLLTRGYSMFQALSPDGSKLAVLHRDESISNFKSYITLVDIETGEANRVGTPQAAAFLAWPADGNGLLFGRQRGQGRVEEPAGNLICRMSLKGEVSEVRFGDNPVLLGDTKRILFHSPEDGAWMTCDLAGGDERRFLTGLPDHAFPAPSPDGKHVLMLRMGKASGPEPLIFDLETEKQQPATLTGGLWGQPAWR